jgi:hypothetical protein
MLLNIKASQPGPILSQIAIRFEPKFLLKFSRRETRISRAGGAGVGGTSYELHVAINK